MIKNRRDPFSLQRTCVSIAGFALLAACSTPPKLEPQPTGWIKDEVADSYVFGYPLVVMDAARVQATGTGPGQAPVNTLHNGAELPPPGTANPPQPNVDTVMSTAWLDLSAEPVILSLPDSRGRYLDARVLDMWTNVVWSTGLEGGGRYPGVRRQTVAFVGPGWKGNLPDGAKRIDAPGRYLWVAVRIQSNGGHDLAQVRRLQRGIHLEPLSSYTDDEPTEPVEGGPADLGASGSVSLQVAALDPPAFFSRLADALPDNPPSPADPHALKILSDLGVKPGAPAALPTNASDAVAAGYADGRTRVVAPPSNLLGANGWTWIADGAGNYGQDYALRSYAASTERGLGTRDDEVRATATQDSAGAALNGDKRYVIHFTARQLPPVRGFWSITAYTKDGALADEGKAARQAVGDRGGLRRNRDGSVDVTVSSARRGANWLQAPQGDFVLVMRLYAPKPQATDGSWAPPAVTRQ